MWSDTCWEVNALKVQPRCPCPVLWETTLDPNARFLLQVKVENEGDAEETFSTLMGETVEHRRNFIQENALKVSNLDI